MYTLDTRYTYAVKFTLNYLQIQYDMFIIFLFYIIVQFIRLNEILQSRPRDIVHLMYSYKLLTSQIM